MNRAPSDALQRGFVLVLTLWVMVILTLAASYFAARVTSAVELAAAARQKTRALIDMSSARAELLYRLSTTTLTEQGLGRGNVVIRLDNRPYRTVGDTVVQLQDNRGLINLNLSSDAQIERLLRTLGVAQERRQSLLDTLRDYTDDNNLSRLNGAEEDSYRARGLPPPTNRPLRTPGEVRRIIGWRGEAALWQSDALTELSSTAETVGINPHTAPAAVLRTLPGVTENIAGTLIKQREVFPLTRESQIIALTGMPVGMPLEAGIIGLPGHSIRITQRHAGFPGAQRFNITLTPDDSVAPWRFDNVSSLSAPLPGADAVDLPPRSTALPDAVPSFLRGQ